MTQILPIGIPKTPPGTPRTPPRQPAYQAALEKLNSAAHEVLASFSDIRSIAVAVDYNGAINDSPAAKGLWTGEHGDVMTPAAVHGSIQNTIVLLSVMFERLVHMHDAMRKETVILANQIIAQQKELRDPTITTPPSPSADPQPLGPDDAQTVREHREARWTESSPSNAIDGDPEGFGGSDY